MFSHFSMRRVILNMNRALKQLTTAKLDKHSQNTWQDKTRHVKIIYNILLAESHYLFNLSVQWPVILNDEYHTVLIWCLSLVICLRVKTARTHTFSHSTGQIKCSIQSDNHNNDFFQCKCQMAIFLYVPFLFGVSSGAFHYRLGSLVDIAHILTQSHSDIQWKQKGGQQKPLIHYNGHFLRSTLIWFAAISKSNSNNSRRKPARYSGYLIQSHHDCTMDVLWMHVKWLHIFWSLLWLLVYYFTFFFEPDADAAPW